jgi:general secretion pathway protein I
MRGFTLIEVIIALAIVAVALTAAARASGLAIDAARTARERVLAGVVADNRLAQLTLRAAAPPIGTESGEESQSDTAFVWRIVASSTPNPLIRRVVVTVATRERSHHTLAEVTAYARVAR